MILNWLRKENPEWEMISQASEWMNTIAKNHEYFLPEGTCLTGTASVSTKLSTWVRETGDVWGENGKGPEQESLSCSSPVSRGSWSNATKLLPDRLRMDRSEVGLPSPSLWRVGNKCLQKLFPPKLGFSLAAPEAVGPRKWKTETPT